jgi:hypothetical protein
MHQKRPQMSRNRFSNIFRRKAGLVVVLAVGLIIVPLTLAKGGTAPWIAFVGLGAAMGAVYIWANKKD